MLDSLPHKYHPTFIATCAKNHEVSQREEQDFFSTTLFFYTRATELLCHSLAAHAQRINWLSQDENGDEPHHFLIYPATTLQ